VESKEFSLVNVLAPLREVICDVFSTRHIDVFSTRIVTSTGHRIHTSTDNNTIHCGL